MSLFAEVEMAQVTEKLLLQFPLCPVNRQYATDILKTGFKRKFWKKEVNNRICYISLYNWD